MASRSVRQRKERARREWEARKELDCLPELARWSGLSAREQGLVSGWLNGSGYRCEPRLDVPPDRARRVVARKAWS